MAVEADILAKWLDAIGTGGTRRSVVSFQGNGVTTSFSFNFTGGYIAQADIKAYVYDEVAETYTDWTPVFTGPNTVSYTPALPNTKFLVIYRDTPIGTPLVDFVAGAPMTEKNLDDQAKQSTFSAAELVDRFDAVSDKTNIAVDQSTTALEQSTTAAADAAAAVVTANTANANASSALVIANDADDKADQALAFTLTGAPTDGDNVFTGNNTFTNPVVIADATAATHAVSKQQMDAADTAETNARIAADSAEQTARINADALKMDKAANLSDVASVATARTNLSVYSKSEVDAADSLKLAKASNLSDVASVATAQTNLDVYGKAISDARYVLKAGDTVSGNLTVGGNVTLTGASRRITADFSTTSPNHSFRTTFQTTTTNAATTLQTAPNGTGTSSDMVLFDNSAMVNCSFGQLAVNSGVVSLMSSAVGSGTVKPLIFMTGSVERMRVNPTGEVGIGGLVPPGTACQITQAATGYSFAINALTDNPAANILSYRLTTQGSVATFLCNGNFAGGISHPTQTTTAYNTSSDRRMKQNIAPCGEVGDVVDSIRVVSYDWKAHDTHCRAGFIAQELAAVAPEAVFVGDDADGTDKPTRPWGVDYSKLVPILVREVQSLRARIAALESTLT